MLTSRLSQRLTAGILSSPEDGDPFNARGTIKDRIKGINSALNTAVENTVGHESYASLRNVFRTMGTKFAYFDKDYSSKRVTGSELVNASFFCLLKILHCFNQRFENDFKKKEMSNINIKIYFDLKDETEMLLNLHGQGLVCLERFLQQFEREKKRNHPDIKFKVSDTDEEANKFWCETVGGQNFGIPKEKFVDAMKKKFKPFKDYVATILDPTSDEIVSAGDFKIFLNWFGPFNKCIDNVESLCESNYFFGSMSSLVCQNLLDSQKIGTFLVRFNEKEPGCIYISCVEEDINYKPSTIHFKVYQQEELYYLTTSEKTKTSLKSLIEKYSLSFKYPYDDKKIKVEKVFSYQDLPPDSIARKRKMDFTYFWGPLKSRDFSELGAKEEVISEFKK
eukprot:gene5992-9990_t